MQLTMAILMNDFSCCKPLMKTLCMLMLLCGISACSGLTRKPETPFDPAKIAGIRFNFGQAELFGVMLPERDIATKVSGNLAEWGYPIGAEPAPHQTHSLTVEIGGIQHEATPVGFSFSAGNSDPRALDFQKSDVLTITCVLTPNAQPQHRAELSMGFVADAYLNDTDRAADRTKLVDLLENDISTVCFNLLSELNVPIRKDDNGKTKSKPGWIPEIRLEIENDKATTATVSQQTTSSDKSSQSQKTQRKRIIIHNQGSPVIFKFGHKRK